MILSSDDFEGIEALNEGDEALWVLQRGGFDNSRGYDYITVKILGRTKTRITVATAKQALQFMRRTLKQYAPTNYGDSVLVPKSPFWLAKQAERRRIGVRAFRLTFVSDYKRIRKLTDEQLAAVYETVRQFLADNEAAKKAALDAAFDAQAKENNG